MTIEANETRAFKGRRDIVETTRILLEAGSDVGRKLVKTKEDICRYETPLDIALAAISRDIISWPKISPCHPQDCPSTFSLGILCRDHYQLVADLVKVFRECCFTVTKSNVHIHNAMMLRASAYLRPMFDSFPGRTDLYNEIIDILGDICLYLMTDGTDFLTTDYFQQCSKGEQWFVDSLISLVGYIPLSQVDQIN